MSLVFVPLTLEELAQLRSMTIMNHRVHACTTGLFEALDYTPDMQEDAEFAALIYASIDCLTRQPYRLVGVAETNYDGSGDDFGTVQATISWNHITALFIDEERAHAQSVMAYRQVQGMDLPVAWEQSEVQQLLAQADLLWHDAVEADVVESVLNRFIQ